MHKKPKFLIFLLTAFLLAGFFGPPFEDARTAPLKVTYTQVYVEFITTPPAIMCMGDTAPVILTYSVRKYFVNSELTPIPKGTAKGQLLIEATQGSLNYYGWDLSTGGGSGTLKASYTATSTGDQAKISLSGAGFTLTGTTVTEPFKVIKCKYTLGLAAGQLVEQPDARIDNWFEAKGGIAVDPKSLEAIGGGTFTYTLSVTYFPHVYSYTCERYVTSTNNWTFTVKGKQVGPTISFSFDWNTLDTKPVMAKCVDQEGKHFTATIIPSQSIDPEEALKLGTVVFEGGETVKEFPFGNTKGRIWLIKRTVKK